MGVLHKPTSTRVKQQEAAGKTAAALMFVNTAETGNTFDATTLAEHSALFDDWDEGIQYSPGQIRVCKADGCMYRCTEEHKSKRSNAPSNNAQTVWEYICNPSEPFPGWSPNMGRGDAWMKGDRCSHAGKHWESMEDYNSREPGVIGWKEVTDDVQ